MSLNVFSLHQMDNSILIFILFNSLILIQATRNHIRIKRGKMDHQWISNGENWQFNSEMLSQKINNVKNLQSHVSPIADNIKCINRQGIQRFTSTISLPNGFVTVPVFEDVSHLNPTLSNECTMNQVSGSSPTFNMKVTDFDKCGVKIQKSTDGKDWLSITIRFPYVGGLRTSEDEHIMIVCRPQESVIMKNHIMDFKSNLLKPPKTIYSSSNQDFKLRVSLFAKPNGATFYTEEIPPDGIIEVGEDLQFRAMVRPGDGWKYAKLRDLTIQRIERNITRTGELKKWKSKSKTPDIAFLVLEDGCRNPVYAALAPKHPYRDPNNPLIINFNFKAFMFQDMPEEGSIRITAKIMACAEENECSSNLCLDNDQHGFGRKRRSILSNGQVNSFTKDLEVKVIRPHFTYKVDSEETDKYGYQCKIILLSLITLITTITVSTICFVLISPKKRSY